MAQVFTSRSNLPKCTTMRDQGMTAAYVHGWKLSEIRKRNKYPVVIYEDPDEALQEKHNPRRKTFIDIQEACFPGKRNFTCGPKMPLLRQQGLIPTIKYDDRTNNRQTFTWPKYPEDVPLERHFTRYGFKPDRTGTVGITPNTFAQPFPPLPPPATPLKIHRRMFMAEHCSIPY